MHTLEIKQLQVFFEIVVRIRKIQMDFIFRILGQGAVVPGDRQRPSGPSGSGGIYVPGQVVPSVSGDAYNPQGQIIPSYPGVAGGQSVPNQWNQPGQGKFQILIHEIFSQKFVVHAKTGNSDIRESPV